MHVKDVRRKNLKALARSVGGVTMLANRLDRAQSQISHLVGANPTKRIGDKMAAWIEHVFNKPHGWLDQVQHIADAASNSTLPSTSLNSPTRSTVPLILFSQINKWLAPAKSYLPPQHTCFIAKTPVSNQAYAILIEKEETCFILGCFSSKGAIVIIDPKKTLKNNSFVMVKLTNSNHILVGQLFNENGNRYLKPLNQSRVNTYLTEQHIIHGAICQIIIDYE